MSSTCFKGRKSKNRGVVFLIERRNGRGADQAKCHRHTSIRREAVSPLHERPLSRVCRGDPTDRSEGETVAGHSRQWRER